MLPCFLVCTSPLIYSPSGDQISFINSETFIRWLGREYWVSTAPQVSPPLNLHSQNDKVPFVGYRHHAKFWDKNPKAVTKITLTRHQKIWTNRIKFLMKIWKCIREVSSIIFVHTFIMDTTNDISYRFKRIINNLETTGIKVHASHHVYWSKNKWCLTIAPKLVVFVNGYYTKNYAKNIQFKKIAKYYLIVSFYQHIRFSASRIHLFDRCARNCYSFTFVFTKALATCNGWHIYKPRECHHYISQGITLYIYFTFNHTNC